jgi:hypothetical protein
MGTHTQQDLELEIAHVLFIDIVGYSTLAVETSRLAACAPPIREIGATRG